MDSAAGCATSDYYRYLRTKRTVAVTVIHAYLGAACR